MQNAGYAALQIIPSFQGFQGNLERGSAGALMGAGRAGGQKFGEAAGKSAGHRFETVFKSTVAALGVIELGRLGVDFIKESIGKASDLNETINKSSVIFGRHERQMDRWAKHAALNLGLSRKGALDSASSFGDMFRQIGFTDDASAKMSRSVVQMAADFGSFSNLGTDDVLERIAGGFRGEYDALQKLIPNISAARVQTEALKESHKKNAAELTAQDKAMATLNILHHDGARAMGDFSRTSQGNANQQKILSAQYDDQTAKLGKSLLPLQLRWMRFLNTEGIPTLSRFSDWFAQEGAPKLNHFADKLEPLAHEAVPALTTALGDARDVAKAALPYAQGIVKAFNDMPEWAQKGLTVGGLAAFAGKKTGLFELLTGSKGSKGGLLGAFTKTSPMPVYVVNEGFGGLPGVPTEGGKNPFGKGAGLLATLLPAVGFAAANQDPAPGVPKSKQNFTIIHGPNDPKAPQWYKDRLEYNAWYNAMTTGNGKISKQTQDLIAGTQKYGDALDATGRRKVAPKFSTPGLDHSTTATQQLLDLLAGVTRPRTARVNVDTGLAVAKLNQLQAQMYQVTAANPVPSSHSKAPRRGSSRPRPVKVSIGGRDFDGYMDDRIASDNDLRGESQRAGRE